MKKPYLHIYFWLSFTLCLPMLHGQQFPVEAILENGSTDSRINLVFLGDGYTAGEMPKFLADVVKFAEKLWTHEPYQNYKNYFNVYAISTPSNESGGAPKPSEMIDNYYGSSYFTSGIERLLYPTRMNRVHQVLFNNFPDYDQVIMLVNDSKYGGGGGWLAAASTHPSGADIAIHEIGHSFSNLRDEYYAGDSFARESDNMTQNNNPETIRWKNWVNSFGIGVFQHCCGGQSNTWYKPNTDCMMERLNRDLCAVCRQTTVARIHTLVPPYEGFSPASSMVQMEGDTQSFSVDLILPAPNTLTTTWMLNGEILEQDFTEHFELDVSTLDEGNHLLTCAIFDDTPMIRIDQHANHHTYVIQWELFKESSTSSIEKVRTDHFKLKSYPNPATTELWVALQDQVPGTYDLSIIDMNGQQVHHARHPFLENAPIAIGVAHLSPGVYTLVLTDENQKMGLIRWVKQ